MEYFATVPELNYMTQIVLMLYEDPQADKSSDKRFHIELHFSPGVKCGLEETPKDPRNNLLPKPQGKKDDHEGTEANVNSKKTFQDDVFHEKHRELSPADGTRMRSGSDIGRLVSKECSSGETDEISALQRRYGSRSFSECADEPVQLQDMLGKSGKVGSESKYKAMSKSLGKTD